MTIDRDTPLPDSAPLPGAAAMKRERDRADKAAAQIADNRRKAIGVFRRLGWSEEEAGEIVTILAQEPDVRAALKGMSR